MRLGASVGGCAAGYSGFHYAHSAKADAEGTRECGHAATSTVAALVVVFVGVFATFHFIMTQHCLKVVIINRWTSLVDTIAPDRILLPSSTMHSSGSLHHCIKINRSNRHQSRFVKVSLRFCLYELKPTAFICVCFGFAS